MEKDAREIYKVVDDVFGKHRETMRNLASDFTLDCLSELGEIDMYSPEYHVAISYIEHQLVFQVMTDTMESILKHSFALRRKQVEDGDSNSRAT